MNEKQYREICDVCDQILKAPDSTIERVAISWLHVVREHPVFLENYSGLFNSGDRTVTYLKKLKPWFRNWAGWIRQFGRAFRSNEGQSFGTQNVPSGVDVLFVSHLLNTSHAGQEHDFYFGDIPSYLSKHKHSALIVLINHTGDTAVSLAEKWKDSLIPRVILPGTFRLLEELSLFKRLKKESQQLRLSAKRKPPGLLKRALTMASSEALSGSTHANLRVAIHIGHLVAKLKPKAIVITHEGHAWERVVFAITRNISPDLMCIGYQHAALFRMQHAIRRKLSSKYNPSLIMTSGNISYSQLMRTKDLDGIPVTVLGSNRIYNKIVETDSVTETGEKNNFGKITCLVLPEGIVSECHLLFEYSLACANEYPNIQFIWRLHPVVEYKSLISKNKKLRRLPNNIIFSTKSFDEDIASSRLAIYRGSTAIIQAVSAGVRPVYLQLPGEMTIDPLYELNEWRATVKSVEDFKNMINDVNEETRLYKQEREGAKKYCDNFFLPINHQIMIDYLDASK